MGRPPIGKTAMSGAERTQRYREKFRHDRPVTKPAGSDHAAVVQELAQAKAELAQVRAAAATANAGWMATDEYQKQTIKDLRADLRAAKAGTAGGKPRPPLPPDEERDRRIKAQATEIQSLKRHILHMLEHAKTGQMPFRARGAILKVLHPDQRDNATAADKDEACRLFTSWTGDNNKARRKAR